MFNLTIFIFQYIKFEKGESNNDKIFTLFIDYKEYLVA